MTPDETYDSIVDTDSDTDTDSPQAVEGDASLENDTDGKAELDAAKEAWDSIGDNDVDVESQPMQSDSDEPVLSEEEESRLTELADPFVGKWNQLISTTNWEKGRIISQWREALIDSGAQSYLYSDDAWARRVGGVTAPHVGRLRRVHDRFVTTYQTYEGLYWSHFLAALDWDDAPLWLEGASQSKWSVSGMREQRWQAQGAVESKRPTLSEIVDVDTDEDIVLPAQGGGRTKEYGDEPGTASGPRYDDPDFGDEEELQSLASGSEGASNASGVAVDDPDSSAPVQPFAGLPELPDDLADAIEAIKLAILRHKTGGWEKVTPETVAKYLEAVGILMRS